MNYFTSLEETRKEKESVLKHHGYYLTFVEQLLCARFCGTKCFTGIIKFNPQSFKPGGAIIIPVLEEENKVQRG